MSDESPAKLTNAQRELLLAAENGTIVWLTRAEYEAYRAAAKVLSKISCRWAEDITIKQTALAALRAAGILEGG